MTGGPLAGLRVVEMAGIGPGPFAAMMLADLGAEVIRIDRITPGDAGIARPEGLDFTLRGRAAIALDLKQPEGVALALDLISGAEALIEGFRPGVMERLGLGPDLCLSRNPRLSYGRLTGWGQEGPLAKTAGHDLTYLAQSGLLSMLGRSGAPPVAPLNLLGDYAGGGMLMVAGLLASVLRARAEGTGQVVDAAMLDGVSLMMVPLCGLIAAGLHDPQVRGGNLLDSGAPQYDSYICACGGYLAIAPIEARFREELLRGLGFEPQEFPDVSRPENWPAARAALAARIASRSRAHWEAVFEGTDACATPVLSLKEAQNHPANLARRVWVEVAGHLQPAPAPRFSQTPAAVPRPPAPRGSGAEALAGWGICETRIRALRDRQILL